MHKKVYEMFKRVGLEHFWGDFFDSRFYIAWLLSKKKDAMILDIGCGAGVLLHSTQASLKVGTDVSFGYLKNSKKLDPSLELIQSDASFLPFRNNSFSIILAMHLFPVMKNLGYDWKKSVAEIKRISNKNSEIMITGSNRTSRHFEQIYTIEEREAYLKYSEIADSFKDAFEVEVEGYGPHSKIQMYPLKIILYRLPEKISEIILEVLLFRILRSKRFLKDGRSYVCICKKK